MGRCTNPRTSTALHPRRHPTTHPTPGGTGPLLASSPPGGSASPTAARTVLGAIVVTTPVVVLARGDALLVRPAPTRDGDERVDARGRLYVPHWLRTRPDPRRWSPDGRSGHGAGTRHPARPARGRASGRPAVNHRQVRARIVLEEAHRLGLDSRTSSTRPRPPRCRPSPSGSPRSTPTFGPSTAATYRPYWRLAADLLGDRRLAELTMTDLAAVVARRRRAGSPHPAHHHR